MEETNPTPTGLGTSYNDDSSIGLVDSAVSAAKNLKTENDRFEELLNRQEMLMAKQQLAGRGEAGKIKEEPKEKTPREYAEEVMAGKYNGE